jgi:4-hydroxymandelate oxidase
VIVSNHGGRNLDTVISTAGALPPVVAAIAGRVPVLVDGGLRRGTDVLSALAAGAAAVLVGRPVLWGLAVDGADGVRAVIERLVYELRMAMALCGARSVPELADLDLLRSG